MTEKPEEKEDDIAIEMSPQPDGTWAARITFGTFPTREATENACKILAEFLLNDIGIEMERKNKFQ